MSYKIRDQIAKLKGVPARHKRVLDAWASFADKDGTNIYASKEAVAERAGISRWTVYRNTNDLVGIGVLVDTGDTHKYGAGHYTTVYRINTKMLQNTTLVGEKLCSKMLLEQCSTMPKTNVAKCDATLVIDPRSADQEETQVSERVSETPTATTAIVSSASETDEQKLQRRQELLTRNLGAYPVERAHELIIAMGCTPYPDSEFEAFTMLGNWLGEETEVWNYWHWNHQHKTGKLVFYTLAQAWDALQSESTRSARRQYQVHKSLNGSCPKHCSMPEFPALVGDPPELAVSAKAAFEIEEDI